MKITPIDSKDLSTSLRFGRDEKKEKNESAHVQMKIDWDELLSQLKQKQSYIL